MEFVERIIQRAKLHSKTIVLPESTDSRTIQAASILANQQIVKVILIGNRIKIAEQASDIDISKIQIIDNLTAVELDDFSTTYYEIRKSKGITLDQAHQLMKDPLFYGTMMVKMGQADGMVAGAIHDSGSTIRPALQLLRNGNQIVSSFFVMVIPDCEYGQQGTFIFSDCGIVPNPTAEELAQIAISSAASFTELVNAEPKVALLSYSTHGSAKGELPEKVVIAANLARQKAPDLILDGELQADAALVPLVGHSKAPESLVAGQANVLIFPDLNSGNIAYKLTQRLAKAEAYGPITQGLLKPVNDLSRGCSVADIVGVAAITAVQAQSKNED